MNSANPHIPSWHAELALRFAHTPQRTVLHSRRHHGPLLVLKPFYEHDDVCQVYLIHPPGGVAGGDQLQLDVGVDDNAHALLTTPASGKVYHGYGNRSTITQHFNVSTGAALEWLPQENIIFGGADVDLTTHIALHDDARTIAWEITCLGRPAGGDHFQHGRCRQRLQVLRNNELLYRENTLLQGEDATRNAAWGLAGHNVTATLVATPCTRAQLQAVREQLSNETQQLCSATLIDELLICRYLGTRADQARELFTRVWRVLRPALLNKAAHEPRVWRT